MGLSDSPSFDDVVSPSLFSEPVETGYENLEWALESLSAQFAIVVRDFDRFASLVEDSDQAAWIDDVISTLATIELYVDPTLGSELAYDQESLEELVDIMLEEADWLHEYSEYMIERFGEYRLGVRLRALSAACFEVARSAPVELPRHGRIESHSRSGEEDKALWIG